MESDNAQAEVIKYADRDPAWQSANFDSALRIQLRLVYWRGAGRSRENETIAQAAADITKLVELREQAAFNNGAAGRKQK